MSCQDFEEGERGTVFSISVNTDFQGGDQR